MLLFQVFAFHYLALSHTETSYWTGDVIVSVMDYQDLFSFSLRHPSKIFQHVLTT